MNEIKPDRNNWKQFCKVEPLTDDEHELWRQLCKANVADDPGLFSFIEERTKNETEAYRTVSSGLMNPAVDWSDLVIYADAYRSLLRAEVEAWKEWLAQLT